MNDACIDCLHLVTTVKEFLQLKECPREWRRLDLYLFRDDAVVFYVGQSYLAFDRVWSHIRDGFKGRSDIGRLILCNWPGSMNMTIELWSSRLECFAELNHDLDAAERALIEQFSPCFNNTLNLHPTPLPDKYAPPTSAIRCSRSLNKLIREAGYAVQAERRRQWLAEGP